MANPLRVLVLRNKGTDTEWISDPLRRAGFDPQWEYAANQQDYLSQIQRTPDLILADNDHQELDILKALDLIRERGLDIPFIIVNGGQDLASVIGAMKRGADDYLVNGGIDGLGASVLQALECKRHRDASKRQELERQAIVNNIPMGLMMSDQEMIIHWVNGEMADMFGTSPQQMVRRSWYEVTPAMKEHREAHNQVLHGEAMEFTEARIPFPDGDRYFDLHYRPVVDHHGKILAMLTMAQDITKRKRTEGKVKHTYEELNRSEKRLAKAFADLKISNEELKATQLQLIQAEKLESVGRLAAGVAHEVKNPLAIIQLDVDYLSKNLTFEDENTPMILEDINNAVRRADSVVKGLLNFSASTDLLTEMDDLRAVIDRSLVLVKHELDRYHINVIKSFEPKLPKVKLDRNKIEQVFVNIFMNAIHAMPDGGTLTINTKVEQLAQAEQHPGDREGNKLRAGDSVVVATVEDTGTGIPEDQLSRIFDPFFTTKPTGKGTGLGLTVTNKIVEMHGGLIDIKNRSEGGVRVRVMFKGRRGSSHEKEKDSSR